MSDSQPGCGCDCQNQVKLIFACSGAADVGHVADLAARRLSSDGDGRMFCLAGVGGRIAPIMSTTESAGTIMAIDGCPLDCTRKLLEEAGFGPLMHLRLSDLGMKKGQSPANESHVQRAAEAARRMLADA